jgi:hypothetical protein
MSRADSRRRKRRQVAPSIRRAQRRVRWTLWASWVQGLLLAVLAYHLVYQAEPRWFLGLASALGVVAAPLMGRAAHRGNSFSAFVLLASVLVPPATVLLRGGLPTLSAIGLLLAPVYVLGVKGATGLRGRRAEPRG